MAKREFLQLAHTLKDKHSISGWFYSTKLDGCRAFWDGGVTRGMLKEQVPWANIDKDGRYAEEQVCSGLWSRYGNIIHAPDWFLDGLPFMPLDGEMYGGLLLSRQKVRGMISKIDPIDSEWMQLYFAAFDMPSIEKVLADGVIDNINFHKVLKYCDEWYDTAAGEYSVITGKTAVYNVFKDRRYESSYYLMKEMHENNPSDEWCVHKQYMLPLANAVAREHLQHAFQRLVVGKGHEGLVIRDPNALYSCERSHSILKYKDQDDAEGTITGYITGRRGKEGKLLGKMGALILEIAGGKRLELSGFTHEERELGCCEGRCTDSDAKNWASNNPEGECPNWIECKKFPRGSVVTFKYRGLTDAGIPNEAVYHRERNDKL